MLFFIVTVVVILVMGAVGSDVDLAADMLAQMLPACSTWPTGSGVDLALADRGLEQVEQWHLRLKSGRLLKATDKVLV